MRFLVISRQARQVAPPVQDRVAHWTACWDYVKQRKRDGALEAFYWTHVLPDGLASPLVMKMIGVINVESVVAAQALLCNYPGYKTEGGLAFELIPILNDEVVCRASDKSGIRFLAIGKPTLYKAPPARDKDAFAAACQAYIKALMDNGTVEYWSQTLGPVQTNAYVFLNVESHEALFAALQDYPATTIEEGIQWQFHALLDSDFCFNSLLEEAKEKESQQ